MSEDEGARTNVLLGQLHVLNVRSHQYANRLWQLPFAYVAIAALAFGVNEKSEGLSVIVSLLLGVIGLAVMLHMACGLTDGSKRAVREIQAIEEELGLERTAEWKPGWYVYPMPGIVALVAVAEFVYAGWLLKN